MDVLVMLAALFGASLLAGLAGSFFGIGGGILLIPFMTLVLGLDIKVAVATSIVGVIATSTGAASVYVRDHLTNLRLGMFLEVGTTLGAIAGAFITLLIPDPRYLFVVFGLVVLYATVHMVRSQKSSNEVVVPEQNPSRFARRLNLAHEYTDQQSGETQRYGVVRPAAGVGIGAVAGAISGLLGVGGGFIKVPAMHVVMKVPMKPAVATSNFMIGVTAAASAFIYYSRGLLDPSLAGAIVVGVYAGTQVGTKLMVRTRSARIRLLFALLLASIGVLMIVKAVVPGVNF